MSHDLSQSKIKSYLIPDSMVGNIIVYDRVDSTNTTAKQLISEGVTHGTVVIADNQTHGKGRMGRSFFSPNGSGIYMSIILPQNHSPISACYITSAAAVAVCRALDMFINKKVQIKWVNDIYIGGKKVCGILAESAHDGQAPEPQYIIVGIGINVSNSETGFPSEIENIATTLSDNEPIASLDRNIIISEVINQFSKVYKEPNMSSFIQEYRNRSYVLDKNIEARRGNEKIYGKVVAIGDMGELVIEGADGQISTLNSGEISVVLL